MAVEEAVARRVDVIVALVVQVEVAQLTSDLRLELEGKALDGRHPREL